MDKIPPPPLSPEAESIQIGFYEHYKGGVYEVIAIARDPDTYVERVFYCRHEDNTLWYRLVKEFIENREVNGQKLPRYRFIGPAE